VDNDVTAGSAPSGTATPSAAPTASAAPAAFASTSVLGHLALGLTLLAFGLGLTGAVDGVTAADAVTLALYVGGVTLFVAGLIEFRHGNAFTGTAFAALGAFWFTWGAAFGDTVSANAAGLFLALWALLTLTLTLGAKAAGPVVQGVYGLLCVALILLAIAQFAGVDGLGKAGGWFAAVSGLVAWYAATAALAHWPSETLPRRRPAHRGVTAAG
jgi:succinate-acetate transporter protein